MHTDPLSSRHIQNLKNAVLESSVNPKPKAPFVNPISGYLPSSQNYPRHNLENDPSIFTASILVNLLTLRKKTCISAKAKAPGKKFREPPHIF